MKTVCFLPILCFFLNLMPAVTSAQIKHLHYIKEDHSSVRDSVTRYGIGDTLVVQYDSVYVFNRTQVRYYELLMQLKVSVAKDNKQLEKLFNELFNNVTKNLADLEGLSKKLSTNAELTSAIGTKLANETLQSVDKTNTLLDSTKVMLDSASAKLTRADLHLQKAEEYIRDAKKKQWWERLKWGGGGVLVGVLVKSVFFKK
jgi:hypothetical protein